MSVQEVNGKHLLKAEPLNAILDPQYFVRQVHECVMRVLSHRMAKEQQSADQSTLYRSLLIFFMTHAVLNSYVGSAASDCNCRNRIGPTHQASHIGPAVADLGLAPCSLLCHCQAQHQTEASVIGARRVLQEAVAEWCQADAVQVDTIQQHASCICGWSMRGSAGGCC